MVHYRVGHAASYYRCHLVTLRVGQRHRHCPCGPPLSLLLLRKLQPHPRRFFGTASWRGLVRRHGCRSAGGRGRPWHTTQWRIAPVRRTPPLRCRIGRARRHRHGIPALRRCARSRWRGRALGIGRKRNGDGVGHTGQAAAAKGAARVQQLHVVRRDGHALRLAALTARGVLACIGCSCVRRSTRRCDGRRMPAAARIGRVLPQMSCTQAPASTPVDGLPLYRGGRQVGSHWRTTRGRCCCSCWPSASIRAACLLQRGRLAEHLLLCRHNTWKLGVIRAQRGRAGAII